MKEDVLVSIILPVYNCEKYIDECIKSVLKQSYECWELIIVDDGSNDNTLNICKQYEKNDCRIHVIHQNNLGVSAARNVAIKEAKGRYITFIDADDQYTEDRIEKMKNILNSSHQCELVYSDYYIVYDETKQEAEVQSSVIRYKTKNDFVDDILFNQKLTCMWRCMMISSIAKEIEFKKIKYAEDLFYILEYIQKCKTIACLSEKMYYYRKNNESSVTNSTRTRKYIEDYKAIPLIMLDYLERNGYREQKYRAKLAEEYVYSSVRIRKATTYRDFLKNMNDFQYRKGIGYASSRINNYIKKVIFLLIKYRCYFPFIFIHK